jgi:hypothetical protein
MRDYKYIIFLKPVADIAVVERNIKMWLGFLKTRSFSPRADRLMIGADLIRAKYFLGHGHFTRWVEARIGMPHRTATRYMATYRSF